MRESHLKTIESEGFWKKRCRQQSSLYVTHLHFPLEPIYRPTKTTLSTKPTKEQKELFQSSSSLDVKATSVLLVPVILSHETHSSRFNISSPLRSTTMALTQSGTKEVEKRCSKRDLTEQKIYTIFACGIVGGIFLVMNIAVITVLIYLKR